MRAELICKWTRARVTGSAAINAYQVHGHSGYMTIPCHPMPFYPMPTYPRLFDLSVQLSDVRLGHFPIKSHGPFNKIAINNPCSVVIVSHQVRRAI